MSCEFDLTTGEAALTVSSHAITCGVMQLFCKQRVAGFAVWASAPSNLLAIAASRLDLLVAA